MEGISDYALWMLKLYINARIYASLWWWFLFWFIYIDRKFYRGLLFLFLLKNKNRNFALKHVAMIWRIYNRKFPVLHWGFLIILKLLVLTRYSSLKFGLSDRLNAKLSGIRYAAENEKNWKRESKSWSSFTWCAKWKVFFNFVCSNTWRINFRLKKTFRFTWCSCFDLFESFF